MQIADIQQLEDGRIHVMLANKRGVSYSSKQEIARIANRVLTDLPLETKIAVALGGLDRPRDAIGVDLDLAITVQVAR